MKDTTTTKEKILKKVRNALIHKSPELPEETIDFEKSIYSGSDDPSEINFAKQFTALAGKFAFCESKEEFLHLLNSLVQEEKLGSLFCLEEKLINMLKESNIPFSSETEKLLEHKAGITFCEYLIARTGSIMISSKQASGRKLPVYPDTHIVVAFTSQMVDDIKDALREIKNKYPEMPSLVSMITGPSRTADIEKTLILGAHGPKEIYCFLIEDTTPA
jgi:L-lactate dehydrogenase complex protein LldG